MNWCTTIVKPGLVVHGLECGKSTGREAGAFPMCWQASEGPLKVRRISKWWVDWIWSQGRFGTFDFKHTSLQMWREEHTLFITEVPSTFWQCTEATSTGHRFLLQHCISSCSTKGSFFTQLETCLVNWDWFKSVDWLMYWCLLPHFYVSF